MSYVADETPLYAVDLVGVVQSIEPVRVINTHNGQRSFLSFLFYDGRHSVKVTFFDEKIASLDPILQGYFETRPIVVLSTLRLNMFKGLIQVNSLSSSRVFFNIDYQPVTVLRHRLEEEGYKAPENYLASPLPSLSHRVIETITLKELSEKTGTDDLNLEGTGEYPPNIKNIVGKELTFRIEISSDNVLLHSRIFNVIDAYDNEYLASSPSNASIGAVVISCFSENTIDLSNCDDTPGTPRLLGADLANLVNVAALKATMDCYKVVNLVDLEYVKHEILMLSEGKQNGTVLNRRLNPIQKFARSPSNIHYHDKNKENLPPNTGKQISKLNGPRTPLGISQSPSLTPQSGLAQRSLLISASKPLSTSLLLDKKLSRSEQPVSTSSIRLDRSSLAQRSDVDYLQKKINVSSLISPSARRLAEIDFQSILHLTNSLKHDAYSSLSYDHSLLFSLSGVNSHVSKPANSDLKVQPSATHKNIF
ncbi:hypothetical protein POM88_002385 [Heracleum sosnowskyi]|uniref:Uncharacterized protein n=1 Tax=Heracleum sosnowskyi TaxID=360622 RepID=A0AAD8N5V8_9APIA|nr:hypothetical protein POM88_002385 [Heracleum sosnowskyi]